MIQRRYDKKRGHRYKEWWSRQSGPPKGELIQISKEVWTGRNSGTSKKTGSDAA